jgi:hypothetical protein
VLRHRGAGKVPVSLAQLPPSLTSLALKKALLTLADDRSLARWHEARRAPPAADEEPGAAPDAGVEAAPSPPPPPPPRPPRPPSRQASGPAPAAPPPGLAPLAVPPAPRGRASPTPGPSHAVESPHFVRAVALGNISTPDLLRLAPPSPAAGAAAAAAAAGVAPGSRPPSRQGAASPSGGAAPGAGAAASAAPARAPTAVEIAPCLAGLRALFLHTSLMPAAVAGAVARASTQLTQLAVVGPEPGLGEEQEAWLAEAAAGRLRALQVGVTWLWGGALRPRGRQAGVAAANPEEGC